MEKIKKNLLSLDSFSSATLFLVLAGSWGKRGWKRERGLYYKEKYEVNSDFQDEIEDKGLIV